MQRDTDLEATLVAKFVVMAPLLDERGRRLWAAAESAALGDGGDAVVSSATGLARQTIRKRASGVGGGRPPFRGAFVDRAPGGRASSRSSRG